MKYKISKRTVMSIRQIAEESNYCYVTAIGICYVSTNNILSEWFIYYANEKIEKRLFLLLTCLCVNRTFVEKIESLIYKICNGHKLSSLIFNKRN